MLPPKEEKHGQDTQCAAAERGLPGVCKEWMAKPVVQEKPILAFRFPPLTKWSGQERFVRAFSFEKSKTEKSKFGLSSFRVL